MIKTIIPAIKAFLQARRLALAGLFMMAFCGNILHAQIKPLVSGCTINGPTSVYKGQTVTYNLIDCSTTGWSTTCGTVQNPASTTANIFFNGTSCSTAKITIAGSSVYENVTITTPPAIVPGSISPSTQSIETNISPAQMTLRSVSGGIGTYTYQWQSSATSSFTSPTNISGATQATYTPPLLSATTYYRVVVTSGLSSANSSTATITVYPQLIPGAITPAPQTIISNTAPAPMSMSAASGGNESYTYQWQSSPNEYRWTNISGATTTGYSPPPLTATTYYQVMVYSNGDSAATNPATVTVYLLLTPGSVSPSSASISYGNSPGQLSLINTSGGNGAITYQWQSSPDNATWGSIPYAIANIYTPPALASTTYFRVAVTRDRKSVV